MVRGGRLRGGYAVEAFSEGMDGDAASLAEFGLGQAAAAEIVEEGVPAEVEDVAQRHGVISRTGLRAPAGKRSQAITAPSRCTSPDGLAPSSRQFYRASSDSGCG